MNKSELIDAIAVRYDGNKKQAQEALHNVIDTIQRELVRGEKVAITGFGAFEKVIRPSRIVRNPRTGEKKRAKKTAVPKFKAGAQLKAVVSGADKLPRLAVSTTKAATKRVTAAKPAATTAKSSPAKTTATKAATKTAAKTTTTAGAAKTTAKKTTAKSTATKTAPATKATATKATTKKAPAKRVTATKATTAVKAPATKTTAKRAAKKS